MGAHCFECIRAGRLPAHARRRQWNATVGPLVTKVLLGINALVFLLTLAGGAAVEARLVLFGPAVGAGEWYRLVTSGFVHFGAIHILFNMVLLYRFGEMLETALGRVRFTALYICSLLGGSLGALLLSPLAFTGGASGAVYGLVGAAAVGLRQRRISVWQSGIGPLLAVNLVLTFAIPGISIGGHLGGLLAGAACGAHVLRTPPSRRTAMEGAALAAAMSIAIVGASVWAALR